VVYLPPSSAANQGSRQPIDKRERTERQAEAKRRKIENGEEIKAPIYATEFSKEEIANEERRPKKKAAVLLGYSGTGYYGMQLFVPSQPSRCNQPVLTETIQE
jgi:tRNA pseudouridine38-40 synthase